MEKIASVIVLNSNILPSFVYASTYLTLCYVFNCLFCTNRELCCKNCRTCFIYLTMPIFSLYLIKFEKRVPLLFLFRFFSLINQVSRVSS